MLTRNLGCRLIRTSVQEDINVSSVFRYLATKCHQIMMQQYNVVPVGQPTISKKYAEAFRQQLESNQLYSRLAGAFSPTFTKSHGTIILRPGKKTSRRKAVLKKCRII